jgi:hypothetical protein
VWHGVRVTDAGDAALARVAAAVVGLQAVVAVVAGVVILVRGDGSYAAGTGTFAIVLGACLGGLAWALHRGRDWARTPVLFVQLLALPIGLGIAQHSSKPAGIAILGVAVATALAVLAT